MPQKTLLSGFADESLNLAQVEIMLQSVEDQEDDGDPIWEMVGSAEAAVTFGKLLLTGRAPITAESQEDKDEEDTTRVQPDNEDAVLADGLVYPIFERYCGLDNQTTWVRFIPVAIGAYLDSLGNEGGPAKATIIELLAWRKENPGYWDPNEIQAWQALGLMDDEGNPIES